MNNQDANWGPKDKSLGFCKHLASDGKYYNGYIDSPDFDPFKEAIEQVYKKIKEELDKSSE